MGELHKGNTTVGTARCFGIGLAGRGADPMASLRGMGRRELLGSSGVDTTCCICSSNARAGWKRDLRSRLLGCLRQADHSLDFFTS